MFGNSSQSSPFGRSTFPRCGCYYIQNPPWGRRYLAQVELSSHTTILGNTSSTQLRQTFLNAESQHVKELQYTFPLYDGVSISEFRCTIGERVITGVVKERHKARQEFQDAVQKGQNAGLLEQSLDAGDVFKTSIGNVGPGQTVLVEITYLGELKNDAENDGLRFTIPMVIAPRYGISQNDSQSVPQGTVHTKSAITVDVKLEAGRIVRGIHSPSHPVSVTMGQLSSAPSSDDSFENNLASMTMSLDSVELSNDFVLVVQSKDHGIPKALLETHPTVPNSRVLMTTLVPRFNLPPAYPEIVFVVDRSGSMSGSMHLVIDAMKIFLKSIPVGTKFNIYSFGSSFTPLFAKSRNYDAESLQIAMNHLHPGSFTANYGGTEMLQPVEAVVKKRFTDLPLEVILLTDGQIHNQEQLFGVINKAAEKNARFFSLGIGSGASSSLVEGIARAGRGFSQWVNDGERMDKKLINMLRGALTPHVKYKLELKFAPENHADDDDFEFVESFEKSMSMKGDEGAKKTKKVISLFQPDSMDEPLPTNSDPYQGLPTIKVPNVLQVPHKLPELYAHSRTTVYLILGPDAPKESPKSVLLRGQSDDGDLELQVQIQDVGIGDTLHKLAAKKAMQDLEEGRGWLNDVQSPGGKYLKDSHPGRWDLIVQREAVRLGTTYQVAGKHCSFVAVNSDDEPVAAESSANPALADYQSGLMLLRQDSGKDRKMMKSAQLFSRAQSAAPAGGFQASPQMPAPSLPSHTPLFGSAMPAPPGGHSSLFGAPQAQTSAFGSTSGGLFGSSTNAPPKPASSGLFGLSSTSLRSTNTGGLFGSAQNTQHMQQLAQMQQQQLQQQAQAQPSSFARAKKAGASLFGSSTSTQRFQQSNSMPSGMAFGNVAAAPPQSLGNPFLQQSNPSNVLDGANVQQSFDSDSLPNRFAASAEISSYREGMQQLIDLQAFSGSWTVTPALLNTLGYFAKRPAMFESGQSLSNLVNDCLKELGVVKISSVSEDMAATICALAWLQTVASSEKDVWEMISEKGRSWVATAAGLHDSDAINTLIQAVGNAWTA